MPIEVNPRNTVRGRPRTTGDRDCARCTRGANRIRITWPEGPICGICFHHAMRTQGRCAECGADRLLPGVAQPGQSRICALCAGIPVLTCNACGQEAEHYRLGTCARFALKTDLRLVLVEPAAKQAVMERLVDVLASADRPESVLAWMRPEPVRELLDRLATGVLPLSHEGFDAQPASRRVEHLRSILEAHGFLEPRDHHLALFERWLDTKFHGIDLGIRQPVEQFARWHHLARIRAKSKPGTSMNRPGVSGDSDRWEGWSHGREHIKAVPA